MKEKTPWSIYQQWLNDGNLKSELSDEVIKKLNPRTILTSLCDHYELTIFLNEHFNNFKTLYQTLDLKEFCYFIKKIIIEKRINTYSLKFLKHETTDKYKKEILPKLPHLKVEEIRLLEKLSKGQSDEKEIADFLGVEDFKIQKIKKSKNKKKEENVKESQEELKFETPSKIMSWESWLSNFSN